MKSSGMVAPLLAGSVAARALLDARALVGVDPAGAVCPAPRADTVLVQPIFYSEFIPYNTVIDPFRNGKPVTINNAPTPIITISDFRTTVLGGTLTLPGTNTVSATPGSTTSTGASATSATGTTTRGSVSVTGTPSSVTVSTATASTTSSAIAGLSLQDSGIPAGDVSNFPFLLLAIDAVGGTKRDLPHMKRQNTNPVNVVSLDGPSNNAFAKTPEMCDSASPLALVNGVLTNGNEYVAKLINVRTTAVGFLDPELPGAVNGTFTLRNSILTWDPTDGLENAVFFSCSDGLYAGFPRLDNIRSGACVQVTVGAISGDKCRQYIENVVNRPVQGNFDQPSGPLVTSVSSSSSSTATATGSATTTSGQSVSTTTGTATGSSSSTTTTTTTTTSSSAAPTTTVANIFQRDARAII